MQNNIAVFSGAFRFLSLKHLAEVRSSLRERLTQSRLTSHVGVRVDKVVRPVGVEDAGLDEAQQGVKLLQVVLDGGPGQQNSEVNRELQGKHMHHQAPLLARNPLQSNPLQ